MPDDAWMASQLNKWAEALTEDIPRAAAVLRQAVGSVTTHVVVAPGKRRGYTQLRFRLNTWQILRAAIGDRIPQASLEAASQAAVEADASPEFTLDLGEPTEMDRWAPQITAWRAEGVTWKEIVRRTNLDLNRVYIAWKRHTQASPGGMDEA